jgi:hypothetical protein
VVEITSSHVSEAGWLSWRGCYRRVPWYLCMLGAGCVWLRRVRAATHALSTGRRCGTLSLSETQPLSVFIVDYAELLEMCTLF